MGDKKKEQLPHLIISDTATTDRYSKPPLKITQTKPLFPERDRQKHASLLFQQLNALRPIEKSITQEQKDFGSEISVSTLLSKAILILIYS